ncbi:MAG TPA: phosphatase [Desulfotomaculum sp.]|jgi:hypothetical protein|nr:phosphatase [Desulfotomaculum sp.]HCJ78898.1 phosphatase [Desulfotomaculum sp.]
MACDLHIHTCASDGTDTPFMVVNKAKIAGLRAIAITDHDTVEGVAPALTAARLLSLEVLPGIELSTEEKNKEVHILGYLINLNQKEFLAQLVLFQQERKKRLVKIVDKLQTLGLPVTVAKVEAIAKGKSVGRPHVARALMEIKAVKNVSEAFEKYLEIGRPAYVPRFKYTPVAAIQLIRLAQGVPVMAHPGLTGLDDLIPDLVKEGLQGLEVVYPGYSPQMVAYYYNLCRTYNLVPTGGSDYHGPEHENKEHLLEVRGSKFEVRSSDRLTHKFAEVTVPYATVQALKDLVRTGN